VRLQALGRMDARLIAEQAEPDSEREEDVEDELERFNDHLLQSHLWVLGGYELVRTLDQQARENPEAFPPEVRKRIRAVKERFERLRVPLAKMEPARRHRKTDLSVPWPAFNPELGVSWRVSRDEYISRRELADLLLDLIESLPDPGKPR